MAPLAKCRLVSRIPKTAYKPGQSGNPRGRTRGSRNRATVEAREVAQRLVDDLEYRDALRKRLIDGTAGAMEPLLWFYAKGKPVERVGAGETDTFATASDAELRDRLLAAIREWQCAG